MRIVCSLTTLPGRISKIKKTLLSLNNQRIPFDAIYLTLPEKCYRLSEPYPDIPEDIAELCTIVRVPQDYGPVTKILGGLLKESRPDTVIITVDDDWEYPRTFVEEYLRAHKRLPDKALASTGAIIGTSPFRYSLICNREKINFGQFFSKKPESYETPVDILYGYSGVLYLRKFFPEKDRLEADFLAGVFEDEDLFLHDDVYISSYLNNNHVPRSVIQISYDLEEEDEKSSDAISGNMARFLVGFMNAIDKCERNGWIRTRQHSNMSESFMGGVVISAVVSFIVVIFVLCVLLVF